jgi:anti-anti-sigma regulatory factor
MPELCLHPRRRPDETVVSLIGPLDEHTAAGFCEQLSTALGHHELGSASVALDLRCCTALDAVGVAALVRVRDSLTERGAAVRITGMSPLMELAWMRWGVPPSRERVEAAYA